MPLVPTNFTFLPQDPPPSSGGPTSPSVLTRFAKSILTAWQNMASVVNGLISFGNGTSSDNINGVWKTVTFASANTNVTITHNLGRIPVGYIVMSKSQAGDVFTGSIAATTTQITLQCSAAGTTVVLFIC